MNYVVYTWYGCGDTEDLMVFDEEYDAVNYCQLEAENYDGRIDYRVEVIL